MTISTDVKIIRLDSIAQEPLPFIGYSWLKEWAVAGDPKESLYVAIEDKAGAAGIWQAEPGTYQMKNYPSHEFCYVLEGCVIITDLDGNKEEYGVGAAFVIPKGFSGTWEMPFGMKKYYVEYGGSGVASIS